MVNWTQRVATGLIGAPIVFYTIQNQIALSLLINIVLYLLHGEFQKLISNVLKHNCSDSDRWYVETMASSWFIRIPTHYFIIMSTLQNNSISVHLHMILAIFFLLLVRLLNYLKISDFLKQNEKTISDKFPSQMVEKKIQMLTFFQMAADIVQFLLFVYPLNFVLIVFQYKQAQALNLIWLISAWQTDNGALFMGSMFGKTLFCPKISPNKTWEGVSGGIFLSVFSSLLLSQMNFLSLITLENLHTKHFLIISLIVSLASIFGDLVESFIKRVADVKDSGTLFPGHGGILDRIHYVLVHHLYIYIQKSLCMIHYKVYDLYLIKNICYKTKQNNIYNLEKVPLHVQKHYQDNQQIYKQDKILVHIKQYINFNNNKNQNLVHYQEQNVIIVDIHHQHQNLMKQQQINQKEIIYNKVRNKDQHHYQNKDNMMLIYKHKCLQQELVLNGLEQKIQKQINLHLQHYLHYLMMIQFIIKKEYQNLIEWNINQMQINFFYMIVNNYIDIYQIILIFMQYRYNFDLSSNEKQQSRNQQRRSFLPEIQLPQQFKSLQDIPQTSRVNDQNTILRNSIHLEPMTSRSDYHSIMKEKRFTLPSENIVPKKTQIVKFDENTIKEPKSILKRKNSNSSHHSDVLDFFELVEEQQPQPRNFKHILLQPISTSISPKPNIITTSPKRVSFNRNIQIKVIPSTDEILEQPKPRRIALRRQMTDVVN